MSIANLEYPNQFDLFCDELTVKKLNVDYLDVNISPINQPSLVGYGLVKDGLVLQKSASFGGAEANLVESPNVIFDPITHQYVMSYVGYSDNAGSPFSGSAMIAVSYDLLNWTKKGFILQRSNVGGTPDFGGVSGPVLFIENGVYYLFYIGCAQTGYEGQPTTLCLATSTSLLGPYTRYANNPIIAPSNTAVGASAWRKDSIWHANINKVDDLYYMFFNATGLVNALSEERTGYATSPDLFTWTVQDQYSPVLPDTGLNTWETVRVGDPSLYLIGDTYYMAYYTMLQGGFSGAGDAIAYTSKSDFPDGWQRLINTEPVLYPTPAYNFSFGAFDTLYAHKPNIFIEGTRHYHYYTAVTGSNRAIALARVPTHTEGQSLSLGLIKTTAQTIANTTPTDVTFSEKTFDCSTPATSIYTWTPATASITVKRGGIYLIDGFVRFGANAAAGIRVLSVRINNVTWHSQAVINVASTTNPENLNISTTMLLTQGDIIKLVVYQSSGAPCDIVSGGGNIEDQSFFCITRLGSS